MTDETNQTVEERLAALEKTVVALATHSITGVKSEERVIIPPLMKHLHEWTSAMRDKIFPPAPKQVPEALKPAEAEPPAPAS